MIDRGEILDLAGELDLRPDIVEKDYVLGWLLAGISRHPSLGSAWLFKGGTCLKKCYLETYRFSEDLDFTIEDDSQLEDQFLRQAFGERVRGSGRAASDGYAHPYPQSSAYRGRYAGLNTTERPLRGTLYIPL